MNARLITVIAVTILALSACGGKFGKRGWGSDSNTSSTTTSATTQTSTSGLTGGTASPSGNVTYGNLPGVSTGGISTGGISTGGISAGSIGTGTIAGSGDLAGTDYMSAVGSNGGNIVYFSTNSSKVESSFRDRLNLQARWLRANPGRRVVVAGHADERGTREYNLALGERRANAVKRYLESQGVSGVSTISYGKERPAELGSNSTAWSKNRRAVTEVR